MKAKLIILIFVLCALTRMDYGILSASTKIGSIYYELDPSTSTAVVVKNPSKYSGSISIPSSVTYNSKTYSVTTIGAGAFQACNALISVSIPNSIKEIKGWAFYRCTSLTSITLPASTDSINHSLFEECPALTAINVNSSNSKYRSIDGVLFNKAGTKIILYPGGKPGVYTLPDNVTLEIGAFRECYQMTGFNVSSTNPNYSVEDGVLFNKDKTTLIRYPIGKIGTSYSVPTGVKIIAPYAFKCCSALLSVSLNNDLRTMEGFIFQYCTGLTSITIPNNVSYLGATVFYGCTSLTSIAFPDNISQLKSDVCGACSNLSSVVICDNISSIVGYAFRSCTSLSSIYNCVTTPQQITDSVFRDVNKSVCTLYVPAESISLYQSANEWKDFIIKKLPTYTIIWKNADGTIIDYTTVEYGQTPTHADPTKPADAEYTYTFAGWTPSVSAVTGDQTYTATYTAIPRDYTIQVKLQNDSIIADGAYPYGTVLKVLAEPDNCFEFSRWSDGNTDNPRTIIVTGDATYTAEFGKLKYTIITESDNPSQGSTTVSK